MIDLMKPLKPLKPLLHRAYAPILLPVSGDPLPAEARARVAALLTRRNSAPEAELDGIDAELVAETYWYALRPDEIARDVLRFHGWRSPLTVDQATTVIAAIGEAGYPIGGNGGPDYEYPTSEHPPVRGQERDRVMWAAARHWAEVASRHITYVSLGDCRGFSPRAVQYDNPGSMHSMQHAALTFGPAADDDENAYVYMRRHTRRLILVRRAS